MFDKHELRVYFASCDVQNKKIQVRVAEGQSPMAEFIVVGIVFVCIALAGIAAALAE